jgi:hypothetical protein
MTRSRLAALAVGSLVAACELPHPFAEDRPPASLTTIRDGVGLSVAPVEGGPRGTAEKLGGAVARALQNRDIPASARTTGPASNQLNGHIETMPSGSDKSTVLAVWVLRDASGKLIGQRTERLEAPSGEWDSGKDETVAKLADASAANLAALLQDEPAKEIAAAAGGQTRVAVRKISGAPGDGGESLAKAVALVLKRQDVTIVDDPKAVSDLYVDCEVTVTPAKPDKQHVKIVWHVRRADGAEIGTVAQENDVPKGILDGHWGDVAYNVALAASGGLAELVARGTPAPRGTS